MYMFQVYLSISDSSLQNELFAKAFQKLKSDDVDKFVRECVMDLLRILVPYQSSENISTLYSLIKKGIADTKNSRHQKKSYRFVVGLCVNPFTPTIFLFILRLNCVVFAGYLKFCAHLPQTLVCPSKMRIFKMFKSFCCSHCHPRPQVVVV